MTIANLPNFATFNGSGSTGPFLFTFVFLDDSQISVEKTTAGVTTALTPNVDFTVSGAGSDSGGSVTLTVALAVGSSITVTRTVPIEQDTSLPNQGPYFAATIEAAFDYLTMICQQLQAQIDDLKP
jgi:archaellin